MHRGEARIGHVEYRGKLADSTTAGRCACFSHCTSRSITAVTSGCSAGDMISARSVGRRARSGDGVWRCFPPDPKKLLVPTPEPLERERPAYPGRLEFRDMEKAKTRTHSDNNGEGKSKLTCTSEWVLNQSQPASINLLFDQEHCDWACFLQQMRLCSKGAKTLFGALHMPARAMYRFLHRHIARGRMRALSVKHRPRRRDPRTSGVMALPTSQRCCLFSLLFCSFAVARQKRIEKGIEQSLGMQIARHTESKRRTRMACRMQTVRDA